MSPEAVRVSESLRVASGLRVISAVIDCGVFLPVFSELFLLPCRAPA
jgi:hypothetical protein